MLKAFNHVKVLISHHRYSFTFVATAGIIFILTRIFSARDIKKKIMDSEPSKKIQKMDLSTLNGSGDTTTDKNINEDCTTKINEKSAVKGKKEVKRLPPNYFLAVRIQNDMILNKLKSVQENIIKVQEKLKPALISSSTFHLTLGILRIDGEEELKKVIETFESCKDKLEENNLLRKFDLTIEGLGHFKNQVVFAKVKKDENFELLQTIANIIIKRFEEIDMTITDHDDFTPHLTLAKLSKAPFLWKKKIKKIPQNSYIDFENDLFGIEEIKNLQLLSMSKPKSEDGYYFCSRNILLDNSI